MNDVTSMKRLPDFIFLRRRDIEIEANLAMAGMLVTDIPKDRQLLTRDTQLIQQVTTNIRQLVEREPELGVAGIWRTGTKPADGLAPPFAEHLLEERSRDCMSIMITSGKHSNVRLPSDLARQIFGGTTH